jgi:hypothetical protein
MLTFSWQPSPRDTTSFPRNESSTAGATPDSTNRAPTSRPPNTTDPAVPSTDTPVTGSPVTISTPAADATRSNSAVTAPIPPTGTLHSPVPLPITW